MRLNALYSVIYFLCTLVLRCLHFHFQSVGYLNYDVWKQMPGFVVDDMRIRRSFPNHPDVSGSGEEGQVEQVRHVREVDGANVMGGISMIH